MTHGAPSASEKEKTARLVASLTNKEQAELLAQALLREFMHRRGLHATLKAFDAENPRDERTISSRALMRQLLNIPVADRPSRLQPTVPEKGGKPQPPTFMEELCSYRLTKRGYTHPTIKLGDEPSESEEDPSDVEVRALHAAVDAHRAAKATSEQQQRRYEEMLAEEEAYQRRKAAHREKKRGKKKDTGKGKAGRRRSNDSASAEEETEDDDDDEEEQEGGALFKKLGRRLSTSVSRLPVQPSSRKGSADTSLTGWQPPGLSEANGGTPLHTSQHNPPPPSPHAAPNTWTPTAAAAAAAPNSEEAWEAVADPFGSGASSQQALMARVRAESRHWAAKGSGSGADGAAEGVSTPKKNTDGAAGQNSPLAALAGVPRAIPLGGDSPPLRQRLGATSGLGALGALGGGGGGNVRRSAAPAGYNPNAVSGPSAFGMAADGSLTPPHAAADGSAAGLADAPYRNGFPPPPSSALAPSIMVRHHSSDGGSSGGRGAKREAQRASFAPTFVGDEGGGAATAAGPAASYNRTAVPRSSALVSSSSGGSRRAVVLMGEEGRSPSPILAPLPGEEEMSPSQTPPRSTHGSGLRHGIGFRTSVSAEATQSTSSAAPAAAAAAGGVVESGEGVRPSRKERRVTLLIE